MSSATTRHPVDRESSSKPRFGTERTAQDESTAVENAEIIAIEIDESTELDYDPYNSTGQFLAAEIRKRNRE